MSVFMYVSPLARPHDQNSRHPVHTLPVAVARISFDGSAACYVFPVLWMTSCLLHQVGLRDIANGTIREPKIFLKK